MSQTVIVTGAASERGIGRGVARRLARHGWSLGLIDLDGPATERLAADLVAEFGIQAVGVGADVSDDAAIDAAVTRFEAELPPITGLVASAGISDPTPYLESTREAWDRVMRVNATGTWVTLRRVTPGMVERGYGRVVTLSSAAAQTGGGSYSRAAYASSKAAIEGLTRGVALELAPFGVTANAIAPATIDTDIMGGPLTEDRKPKFVAALPVGRVGTVEEVAALIEFLLGEEAGYITGVTYNINGGHRIG